MYYIKTVWEWCKLQPLSPRPAAQQHSKARGGPKNSPTSAQLLSSKTTLLSNISSRALGIYSEC